MHGVLAQHHELPTALLGALHNLRTATKGVSNCQVYRLLEISVTSIEAHEDPTHFDFLGRRVEPTKEKDLTMRDGQAPHIAQGNLQPDV